MFDKLKNVVDNVEPLLLVEKNNPETKIWIMPDTINYGVDGFSVEEDVDIYYENKYYFLTLKEAFEKGLV